MTTPTPPANEPDPIALLRKYADQCRWSSRYCSNPSQARELTDEADAANQAADAVEHLRARVVELERERSEYAALYHAASRECMIGRAAWDRGCLMWDRAEQEKHGPHLPRLWEEAERQHDKIRGETPTKLPAREAAKDTPGPAPAGRGASA